MSVFWGTRKCSADVDYAKLTGRHLEPLLDVAQDAVELFLSAWDGHR